MQHRSSNPSTGEPGPGGRPARPPTYQIRIRGHLPDAWADWFEGMTITLEDGGDTLLCGPVADQAALFGLLRKVRDLGMPLISVAQLPQRHNEASTDPDREESR